MTLLTGQTCTFVLQIRARPYSSSHRQRQMTLIFTVNGNRFTTDESSKEPNNLTLGYELSFLSTPLILKVYASVNEILLTRNLDYNNKSLIETYLNINSVWTAFENTLISADGILSYGPVFADYLYEGFRSYHEDNVQYIEIRTTLFKVCNFLDL